MAIGETLVTVGVELYPVAHLLQVLLQGGPGVSSVGPSEVVVVVPIVGVVVFDSVGVGDSVIMVVVTSVGVVVITSVGVGHNSGVVVVVVKVGVGVVVLGVGLFTFNTNPCGLYAV